MYCCHLNITLLYMCVCICDCKLTSIYWHIYNAHCYLISYAIAISCVSLFVEILPCRLAFHLLILFSELLAAVAANPAIWNIIALPRCLYFLTVNLCCFGGYFMLCSCYFCCMFICLHLYVCVCVICNIRFVAFLATLTFDYPPASIARSEAT